MSEIAFEKAYYIKLGTGGEYEDSSIQEGKLRFGWMNQKLQDINDHKWDVIHREREKEYKSKKSAAADLNALKRICTSTSQDIWIAFSGPFLWWCRLTEDKTVYEDTISRYRLLSTPWSNRESHGRELVINQLPGVIAKIQAFRGTVCRVRQDPEQPDNEFVEVSVLKRLLNHQVSRTHRSIAECRDTLIDLVEQGIRLLHWSDFELLVDLVFTGSGWKRTSVIGDTMKFADMHYVEPLSGASHMVQVKSSASVEDFRACLEACVKKGYPHTYFVIHTLSSPIEKYLEELPRGAAQLFTAREIAEKVVDMGHTAWLLHKIR